jgi:rfaE bifunctional protein kinase chain/domain
VLGNNTQMLRVDEEITEPLSPEDSQSLAANTERILLAGKTDAVIFQDYDKGTISTQLIEEIIARANALEIPVAVDPKKKHFKAYKHATLFKPNFKELKEGVKGDFSKEDHRAVAVAAAQLQKELHCKVLMVTLSENGILLRTEDTEGEQLHHQPAHRREIADVSGAGDTVISVAALCLAQKVPVARLAALANLAGGLVCEEAGVVPVNVSKLMEEALEL